MSKGHRNQPERERDPNGPKGNKLSSRVNNESTGGHPKE